MPETPPTAPPHESERPLPKPDEFTEAIEPRLIPEPESEPKEWDRFARAYWRAIDRILRTRVTLDEPRLWRVRPGPNGVCLPPMTLERYPELRQEPLPPQVENFLWYPELAEEFIQPTREQSVAEFALTPLRYRDHQLYEMVAGNSWSSVTRIWVAISSGLLLLLALVGGVLLPAAARAQFPATEMAGGAFSAIALGYWVSYILYIDPLGGHQARLNKLLPVAARHARARGLPDLRRARPAITWPDAAAIATLSLTIIIPAYLALRASWMIIQDVGFMVGVAVAFAASLLLLTRFPRALYWKIVVYTHNRTRRQTLLWHETVFQFYRAACLYAIETNQALPAARAFRALRPLRY